MVMAAELQRRDSGTAVASSLHGLPRQHLPPWQAPWRSIATACSSCNGCILFQYLWIYCSNTCAIKPLPERQCLFRYVHRLIQFPKFEYKSEYNQIAVKDRPFLGFGQDLSLLWCTKIFPVTNMCCQWQAFGEAVQRILFIWPLGYDILCWNLNCSSRYEYWS